MNHIDNMLADANRASLFYQMGKAQYDNWRIVSKAACKEFGSDVDPILSREFHDLNEETQRLTSYVEFCKIRDMPLRTLLRIVFMRLTGRWTWPFIEGNKL